jgi:hypothetical protein
MKMKIEGPAVSSSGPGASNSESKVSLGNSMGMGLCKNSPTHQHGFLSFLLSRLANHRRRSVRCSSSVPLLPLTDCFLLSSQPSRVPTADKVWPDFLFHTLQSR